SLEAGPHTRRVGADRPAWMRGPSSQDGHIRADSARTAGTSADSRSEGGWVYLDAHRVELAGRPQPLQLEQGPGQFCPAGAWYADDDPRLVVARRHGPQDLGTLGR